MTINIKSWLLIPLLVLLFNISNAQINKPLKGRVLVNDGYTVYLIKYDETVDYYVEDSLNKPVSVKKIKASILFKYTDETSIFLEGSKNKKKNLFSNKIPTEDKKIKNIAVLIEIDKKRQVAAYGYPQS